MVRQGTIQSSFNLLDYELDSIYEQAIDIIQHLIRLYPAYGKPSILEAQEFLAQFLKHNLYGSVPNISVSIDTFTSSDIDRHPSYIKVENFDDHYQNYSHLPKYNLIAVVDSGVEGPTLILNGHVDVDIVNESSSWMIGEGWKTPIIIDDRLYGRGSADMLGGLAGMIVASSAFVRKGMLKSGKIIIHCVCDEEIGGNGSLRAISQTSHLMKSQTLCVIAEPTENQMCNQSLGFMHITLIFKGKPVHMGVAKPEDNAMTFVTQFYQEAPQAIAKIVEDLGYKHHPDLFRFNIGKIQGGIDSAIPIDNLSLSGTLFYPDFCSAHKLFQGLKEYFEMRYPCHMKKSDFGFNGAHFEIDFLHFSSIKNLKVLPSPCDARLYKEADIPTLIWGPGSLKQAHSVNEYLSLNQLKAFIHEFYEFLKNYF